MNADCSKIDELVKRAVLAGLDGVDFLQGFDYADLVREYNGIGPEWAGAAVRGWVTRHLSIFEPAALIHDMRNAVSDGTRAAFFAANVEFAQNCLRLVDAAFGWWNWKRYALRGVVLGMYEFVSGPGGWAAWHDCHEKNMGAAVAQERDPPMVDEISETKGEQP